MHNSTKVKPKPILLILPAKVPHDCPTAALQRLHTLIFSDMSSAMDLCNRACKTFLAHCPANLAMRLHYSPEKNARSGNKSKYTFLGIHHSQTHRTAWLLWSPVQEMRVRGGKGFLISQTNSLFATGSSLFSLKCHVNLNIVVNKKFSHSQQQE